MGNIEAKTINYSKRFSTKFNGVFYRESITNDKLDKTYYIRYKDKNNKDKEIKIGKYSEGFRENYCNQLRNEIITKQRIGEEPPAAVRNKKKRFYQLKLFLRIIFQKEKKDKLKEQINQIIKTIFFLILKILILKIYLKRTFKCLLIN